MLTEMSDKHKHCMILHMCEIYIPKKKPSKYNNNKAPTDIENNLVVMGGERKGKEQVRIKVLRLELLCIR